MMRNRKVVEAFERDLIRRTPPDYWVNLKLFEALYEQARVLGLFPLKDPLEGIEVDLRLARVLNVRSSP